MGEEEACSVISYKRGDPFGSECGDFFLVFGGIVAFCSVEGLFSREKSERIAFLSDEMDFFGKKFCVWIRTKENCRPENTGDLRDLKWINHASERKVVE
ncbi:hypothetical protein SUGI_1118500 [Cryptomeria japonica]|nr:hypothetical protein SUGI_1118500 [Cryptomeria japonica]